MTSAFKKLENSWMASSNPASSTCDILGLGLRVPGLLVPLLQLSSTDVCLFLDPLAPDTKQLQSSLGSVKPR